MRSQRLRQILLPFLFLSCGPFPLFSQTYLDPKASVDARVEDLLSRMTLREKIGQMTQTERNSLTGNPADITTYALGSILSGGGSSPYDNTPRGWADMVDGFQKRAMDTRLHIPLLYGIDAVHGHNTVYGAVIFPHNIAMGCTRNPALVEMEERVTAVEMTATGIHWTFGPCIAVPQNERWGRTFEGFGETAELAQMLAPAAVRGFQGKDLAVRPAVLACPKHYLGDGGTLNGTDTGNTVVDEATLRALHLPGYVEAVKAGAAAIMASYNSWNGLKMHGSRYWLTDVLKGELGFKGFIVSDYDGIQRISGDYAADLENGIDAGIDMAMLSSAYAPFIDSLVSLVQAGRISTGRIDDAVRRILRVKFMSGLFEHPYADRAYLDSLGTPSHRAVARECVRKSLVLLKKKDGVLPIPKNARRIHVAGVNADDIGAQCGGWTMTWQGRRGNITPGTTVLQAIKNAAPSAVVTSDANGSGAAGADLGIAVIGESPYAEYAGDRDDLGLSSDDVRAVRAMKQAGVPVVAVLISGRPLLVQSILHFSDALIAAWLPGTEGSGVADVLFGDYEPQGKLSHSWPRAMEQIPINWGDETYDPLFPYGFGITDFKDAPKGSAPVLMSAAAFDLSNRVELTFNKTMRKPDAMADAFDVSIDGQVLPVSGIGIASQDSTTMVLTLGASIKESDALSVSYDGKTALKSADNGVLERFGPVEADHFQDTQLFAVPGKIEAENFIQMSGVQVSNTSDEGGGYDLEDIQTGDWAEYGVNAAEAGVYTMEFRVASSVSSGRIRVYRDGTSAGTMPVPNTGGMQIWSTVQLSATLKSGIQIIRLSASAGGFALNWFSISKASDVEQSGQISVEGFRLFQNKPNPFSARGGSAFGGNPSTTICYSLSRASKVDLRVFDLMGREVAVLVDGFRDKGMHELEWTPDGLASGLYFCRLSAGEGRKIMKMLFEK